VGYSQNSALHRPKSISPLSRASRSPSPERASGS
jgi:hypothetical protein